MLLAVRKSSYGCTLEVWRALKKLELLLAITSSLVHFIHALQTSNFIYAS